MFSSSNFGGNEGGSDVKVKMGSTAIMECHFRGYENDDYCYKRGTLGRSETGNETPKKRRSKKH